MAFEICSGFSKGYKRRKGFEDECHTRRVKAELRSEDGFSLEKVGPWILERETAEGGAAEFAWRVDERKDFWLGSLVSGYLLGGSERTCSRF